MISRVNSTKLLKKGQQQLFLNSSKNWRWGNTSKFTLWGLYYMIPKPNTASAEYQLCLIDWCINPQENTRKRIQQNIKMFIYCDQVGFVQFKIGSTYINRINVISHINQMKKLKHMIISIQVGKEYDKIQHSFLIKNTQIRSRENSPTWQKLCMRSVKPSHHGQRWEVFTLKSTATYGCHLC